MNERTLTIFYPKIKRNINGHKKGTITKLNLTNQSHISNIDFIDVLSQIKSKKNNIGNYSLYQKFNNKQKKSDLRYKLFNKYSQTQTALITEANYERKKFDKLSKNTMYSNSYKKNRLILNKNLSTPKKLLNKIIKFEEEKKVAKKIKLIKRRIPIQFTNSYQNFVKKMSEINFTKFTNSQTDYAHNIRASFFLDKVNESIKNEINKNKVYLEKEKEKIEDEKELRDEVFCPSLDLQKISKEIKLILGKEHKFNQFSKIREKFFDNFVNRVNFLYDNFKPPNIKNNLTRIIYEDMKNEKKLSLINRIGNSAINYLSHVTVKLQREKDEKVKFLIEKNKIKKKYNYYRKLSSSNIYNSKEEIEKLIYKDYYTKKEDDLLSGKENIIFDDVFEKKNYFENKIEKFNDVNLSDERSRRFVFDNLNIKFDLKKYNDNDFFEKI